jgi:hypothetical protein
MLSSAIFFRAQCLFLIVTLISALGFLSDKRPVQADDTQSRLLQIVEANVLAVHSYQTDLGMKGGKGSPVCYDKGALTDHDLQILVAHQTRLLTSDLKDLVAWAKGQFTAFDPSRDLAPILQSNLQVPESTPVNVYFRYLRQHSNAPQIQLRAIANLYQTVLEVERDGDLLQQEFDLYIALGLPVYVGQLHLPGTDEDFLSVGKDLSGQTCESPFDTNAPAWQIAGRKVWNWGEKKLHIRDVQVLARELLAEPDVRPLIPRMRELPAQKVAIIGHSFTMDLHWSSPSSFVAIVTAMFGKENAKVQFRQFQAGGLSASRALKNFYPESLAWKPDKLLLVVMVRKEEDFDALRAMGEGFRKAGIRVFVFDNVHDPEASDPQKVARINQVAREAGVTVIKVDSILSNAPDRGQFLCLDKIHMKEPYHRLMAKEWLRFLVGARGDRP